MVGVAKPWGTSHCKNWDIVNGQPAPPKRVQVIEQVSAHYWRSINEIAKRAKLARETVHAQMGKLKERHGLVFQRRTRARKASEEGPRQFEYRLDGRQDGKKLIVRVKKSERRYNNSSQKDFREYY